jgi:hypothetical protein
MMRLRAETDAPTGCSKTKCLKKRKAGVAKVAILRPSNVAISFAVGSVNNLKTTRKFRNRHRLKKSRLSYCRLRRWSSHLQPNINKILVIVNGTHQ